MTLQEKLEELDNRFGRGALQFVYPGAPLPAKPFEFMSDGELDAQRTREAWQELQRRHPGEQQCTYCRRWAKSMPLPNYDGCRGWE